MFFVRFQRYRVIRIFLFCSSCTSNEFYGPLIIVSAPGGSERADSIIHVCCIIGIYILKDLGVRLTICGLAVGPLVLGIQAYAVWLR